MALRDRRRKAGDRDDIYWVNLEPQRLAERIMDKVGEFDDFLKSSGLLWLYMRLWSEYHLGVVTNRIETVGERDQYTRLKVNHFKNIIDHVYVNITSQEPPMKSRATNMEYKSRSQVQSNDNMLEYYNTEQDVSVDINTATKSGILVGEGWVCPRWDAMAGDLVAMGQPTVDESGKEIPGAPIHLGDIAVDVIEPWDVIRDINAKTFKACRWFITRRAVNRFDLIAERPDLRDKILDLPDIWAAHDEWTSRGVFDLLKWTGKESTADDVYIYTLYHRKSAAVPFGRVTSVLSHELVWSDETLEANGLDRMPLCRIAAADMQGYPFGVSFAPDLLAPAEGGHLLNSTIMTNNAQHGVQSLVATAGSNATARQLENGMVLIEITPGDEHKLEALQLTKTAAETFTFKDHLKQDMQELSGVNSVERGAPDPSLKSGVALALVQAQSLEFQGDMVKSRGKLRGKVGTVMTRLFKTKVKLPRAAAIVGKGERSHLKELKGADIADVDAVTVEDGSPLLSTAAGRVNYADQLIQMNQIETPEQLAAVLATGRLEPLTKHREATFELIQLENEQIMSGQNPPVLLTDQHHLHILEHQVVGSDPEVRKQPMVVDVLLRHLQEHIDALKSLPPELAALLKMPVIPQLAPGPGAPDGSALGAPGGEGLPGGPAVPGVQSVSNPVTGGEIPGAEMIQ